MKQPLILALLLASAASANAAYQDQVIADQPVGYWRLGDAEGAASAANAGSLGAAGNGTIFNNVAFGWQGALTGNANTAASLDGAQAKIEVPFAPDLNPAVFTIEVWAQVTPDSTGHRSPLASRDDFPQKGYIFYADPGNNWQFWTGTGEQVGWNVVGGASVEPDAWTHLVGVYDGANKFFYVNGVLVGANQSLFTPNGARPLRIGASANEDPVGNFFFAGGLDEVAVYNKVLPEDRIIAHYQEGSGTAPASDIAPAFAVQPVSADRFRTESVTLTALATGSLPLKYQWKKDDQDVPGATGPRLVLNNLEPSASGSYTVVVSNGAGSATSEPATLAVADASKPVITQQPRSRTVLPGANASFSVSASGSTAFQYQWMLNNQPIAWGTNATLNITNVQTASLGEYKVTVKNPAGSTDSEVVTLKIPAPAAKSYTATVLDDKPVGYWRLGESTGEVAEDSAGNNDGALLNGVILGRPGAPVGDANTAAGFSAASQTKIDVPWSEELNPATFTVEAWAKVTGGSGHRSPLTSRADFPQAGYIFYAEPGNTWQFWTGTGEQVGWTSLQGPAVQLNSYAHLVGVYDGATLFFYVNGVLAAQRNATVGPNTLNPLRIGGGATEGDGTFWFEGDVDEVAVYNVPLSEERILAHYVAGFPLTTPPSITVQPRSQLAPPGGTVRFTVSATGGQPLTYQWKFNGQDLPNATASTLVIPNVSAANAGNYQVVVSNAGGPVSSDAATLAIPAPSTKSYAELIKGDGPVGYWRLGESSGETANDEIGANDGLLLNGVTLGAAGALGADGNTAARFSRASRQKIDVPWSEALNPPQFTVEVWARVTGSIADHRSPLTSRADGPQRGYIFYAEPGNTWQFWTGKGDSTGWDVIPGPAVQPEKWTHLAATYDGVTKRFFVNGVEAGASTAAFGANDQSPLRFGGGATEGDGNFFFEGDIDEPAIYNKALTHEQIILHYLAGAAKPASPTITIARQGNTLNVTWTTGALESAPNITGPWSLVTGAASPYSVTPDQTARFYRLRQ